MVLENTNVTGTVCNYLDLRAGAGLEPSTLPHPSKPKKWSVFGENQYGDQIRYGEFENGKIKGVGLYLTTVARERENTVRDNQFRRYSVRILYSAARV